MACEATPGLASGCVGHPWTLGWLPAPYIQASPGLISNFTISPQATSAFRAPAVFIASAHCPQGHLQLRTKALSFAWGCRGKTVVSRQYCRRTPEEEACRSPFRDTGSVPPSLFLKCCLKLAPFSTLLQSHFKKDESIEDYKKSTENCT